MDGFGRTAEKYPERIALKHIAESIVYSRYTHGSWELCDSRFRLSISRTSMCDEGNGLGLCALAMRSGIDPIKDGSWQLLHSDSPHSFPTISNIR